MNKLKINDEIRVICPSSSFKESDKNLINKITNKLSKLGFKITFGKYIYEMDDLYKTASIEKRVKDLHEAFLDKNVKIIICGKGGFNVNQILPYIDYELIKNNPKIICGFSDITALLLAIYNKADIPVYLGPTYLKLDDSKTLESFLSILTKKNKETLEFPYLKNSNLKKEYSGIVIGGNLCTINLLQGTKYLKKKKNVILFIEEDDNYKEGAFFREFDRNLESLLQTEIYEINAICFGKFEKSSEMTKKKLEKIIITKGLINIPIIYNISFGHIKSLITIPIGKKINIHLDEKAKLFFE